MFNPSVNAYSITNIQCFLASTKTWQKHDIMKITSLQHLEYQSLKVKQLLEKYTASPCDIVNWKMHESLVINFSATSVETCRELGEDSLNMPRCRWDNQTWDIVGSNQIIKSSNRATCSADLLVVFYSSFFLAPHFFGTNQKPEGNPQGSQMILTEPPTKRQLIPQNPKTDQAHPRDSRLIPIPNFPKMTCTPIKKHNQT